MILDDRFLGKMKLTRPIKDQQIRFEAPADLIHRVDQFRRRQKAHSELTGVRASTIIFALELLLALEDQIFDDKGQEARHYFPPNIIVRK